MQCYILALHMKIFLQNASVSSQIKTILGDPGAARWGGKKIRAKKSQERREEPLGTEF